MRQIEYRSRCWAPSQASVFPSKSFFNHEYQRRNNFFQWDGAIWIFEIFFLFTQVNECDEDGWTALTHAVVLGKLEAVNILLRKYLRMIIDEQIISFSERKDFCEKFFVRR